MCAHVCVAVCTHTCEHLCSHALRLSWVPTISLTQVTLESGWKGQDFPPYFITPGFYGEEFTLDLRKKPPGDFS